MGVSKEEGSGMRRLLLSGILAHSLMGLGGAGPASGQETHLLTVVGLGGDPEYRELFHGWAADLTSAAAERFNLAEERIVYLGERPDDAPGLIDDRSSLENLTSVLAGMAGEASPRDQILIVLIGHGTGQGEEARFNLPGPDLTPQALDLMLADFPTQTVAVVNTTPSSGPFLSALSGPNRVILTATRTAQERNETQFGGFFVEALLGDASDLDKDGRLSLTEAFQYAKGEVNRYYESLNLLATEHAQLDDNGDGVGSVELGEDSTDGRLAGAFWLGSASGLSGVGTVPDSIADPELSRLYQEKAELERRVQELRNLRGRMEESQYEAELEALLVELALKNREIREKGGGG
jgi:hypothetical protein